MGRRKLVSVFNYLDFRRFFQNAFNAKKRANPRYTHRFFAKKAGYNSSSLLTDVISGRINIKPPVAANFARGFGLNPRETVFLDLLVKYNQAATLADKNRFFSQLMGFFSLPARRLNKNQIEYCSRWYYIAVREVLSFINVKKNIHDFQKLASVLKPRISLNQARRSINILKRLKLIKKDDKGFFRSSQATLSTGPLNKSLHVPNFQRTMMDLAKESIDRFPPEQRNISTLTFSASAKAVKAIQAETDAYRKKLIGIIQRCRGMDRAYQLNTQLFPLTQIKKVKKDKSE